MELSIKKKEEQTARKYKEQLDIKTPSLDQQLKNLSGGNQQKVVLAKSLATESDILIFDEPHAALMWALNRRSIDTCARWPITALPSL